MVRPFAEAIAVGEPESDLIVGRLDGVRAVDDVAANMDAEVTTDSAWLRVEWLGSTEHLAASEDGVVTFPDHGADGAGGGVVDKSSEETPETWKPLLLRSA